MNTYFSHAWLRVVKYSRKIENLGNYFILSIPFHVLPSKTSLSSRCFDILFNTFFQILLLTLFASLSPFYMKNEAAFSAPFRGRKKQKVHVSQIRHEAKSFQNWNKLTRPENTWKLKCQWIFSISNLNSEPRRCNHIFHLYVVSVREE